MCILNLLILIVLLFFGGTIKNFINNPFRVFILCLIFILSSVVFSGNLLTLYGLNRDSTRITSQINLLNQQISELDQQIKIAKNPQYIERQALDHYDMVDENDLIFIFSESQKSN